MVTTIISIISVAVAVASFFIARHKDTKTDAKDEAYKQGLLDEKLNNIFNQLNIINAKLDKYDSNFDEFKEKIETEIEKKINEAITNHIAIYHKEQK